MTLKYFEKFTNYIDIFDNAKRLFIRHSLGAGMAKALSLKYKSPVVSFSGGGIQVLELLFK
jgi:putative lipase involved disintegration of autophagic bodies